MSFPSQSPEYRRRYRHRHRLEVLRGLEQEAEAEGAQPPGEIGRAERMRRSIKRYVRRLYDDTEYLPPPDLGGSDKRRRDLLAQARVVWQAEITNQVYVPNLCKDAPMSTRAMKHQQDPGSSWTCSPEFYESTVLPLINEAQKRLKSIRLVSTRLAMNEGWAQSVKTGNRKIVTQASVDGLRALVHDLREEEKNRLAKEAERATREAERNGMRVEAIELGGEVLAVTPSVLKDVTKKLAGEVTRNAITNGADSSGTDRQLDQIKELCHALSEAGCNKAMIGKVFGYKTYTGVYLFLTGRVDKMPRWRIERATAVLDAMRRGDQAEADRLMALPSPIEKAEREPRPEEELSGKVRDIRRIGPTPAPRAKPQFESPAPPSNGWKPTLPTAPAVTDFAKLEAEARKAQKPDLQTAWDRTVTWATPALFPPSIATGLRAATLKEQNGDVVAYVSMSTANMIDNAPDSTRRRIDTMGDRLKEELGRAVSLTVVPPEYQRERRRQEEAPTTTTATPPEAKRTRAAHIAELRDRLTHIALVEFDEIKKADLEGQPKFLHAVINGAWDTKRDELLTFIEGLE